MQLFLFFESKDFRSFFVQHADDAVEHRVVQVWIVDGDRVHGPAERLRQRQPDLEAVEGLRRAVETDDDGALAVVDRIGIAHDERVALDAAHEAFGDRAELAVPHRAHAERAHDHEIVVRRHGVLDERLVVLAVHHLRGEGQARGLGLGPHHVEIGLRDELQAHGDERVVDLSLTLELVLVLVFVGERVLHLLEPIVVQPRGVDVGARETRAEGSAELDREVDRAIAVLRVVDRHIDVLVHALPRLLEFELERGAASHPQRLGLRPYSTASQRLRL